MVRNETRKLDIATKKNFHAITVEVGVKQHVYYINFIHTLLIIMHNLNTKSYRFFSHSLAILYLDCKWSCFNT